ncbi:hypothetical protein GGR51DRAFT_565077 [Nemania sp. FL0031]|nr:hypothetical protein GGR51DRAFT_565077 [Nemania sp. FL0031]
MAPENTQATPATSNERRESQREEGMQEIALQPTASQPMNPERPHDEPMNLRGGERSSLCPGRFCFCVPCPLPCDFCII